MLLTSIPTILLWSQRIIATNHTLLACKKSRSKDDNNLIMSSRGGTTLYVTVSAIKGVLFSEHTLLMGDQLSYLTSSLFAIDGTILKSSTNIVPSTGFRPWYARSRSCLRIRTVCLPDVEIFLVDSDERCDASAVAIVFLSMTTSCQRDPSSSSSSFLLVHCPPSSSALSPIAIFGRDRLLLSPSPPRSIEREQIDCDAVGCFSHWH
jgi:hypothetical protein